MKLIEVFIDRGNLELKGKTQKIMKVSVVFKVTGKYSKWQEKIIFSKIGNDRDISE